MTRTLLAVAAAAFLVVAAGTSLASPPELKIVPPPQAPQALAADRVTVGVRIKRGSTLGTLLGDYGVSANAVRKAALELYDLAKIRPDRDLQLVYVDGEPEPSELRYTIDTDHTVVVERQGDGAWQAHIDERVYETSLETLQVYIGSSLWADGLRAGLRPADMARLAEVFEYELDFNSELQAGASLSVVADVMTSGSHTRLGDVHAVRISNSGKSYTAVLHKNGDEEVFYHPDGTGMKRPFLRSPLAFSARVTSSFNPKRFHPVLKKRRPHNGTDFGAPSGTSVRTVAAGLVTFAGRNGGHGNFVKVKHDNGYETSYSHLSRISVRKGQRISQGTRVGKVGSTGMSTGPHLHWQMWKHGRYVDAMRTRLPNSAPLPKSAKATFKANAQKYTPMLDETAVADLQD